MPTSSFLKFPIPSSIVTQIALTPGLCGQAVSSEAGQAAPFADKTPTGRQVPFSFPLQALDRVALTPGHASAIRNSLAEVRRHLEAKQETPAPLMRALTVLYLLSGGQGAEKNIRLAGDLLLAGQGLSDIEATQAQECLAGYAGFYWPLILIRTHKPTAAKFVADLVRAKSFAGRPPLEWLKDRLAGLYSEYDRAADVEIARLIHAMTVNLHQREAQILLDALAEDDFFFGIPSYLAQTCPQSYRLDAETNRLIITHDPASGKGFFTGLWARLGHSGTAAFGKLIGNAEVAGMFAPEACETFLNLMRTGDTADKLSCARVILGLDTLRKVGGNPQLLEVLEADLWAMGLALTHDGTTWRVILKSSVPAPILVGEANAAVSSPAGSSVALALYGDADALIMASPAEGLCTALREQIVQGLVGNAFLLALGVLSRDPADIRPLLSAFTRLTPSEMDALISGAPNAATLAAFLSRVLAPEHEEAFFILRLQALAALCRLPADEKDGAGQVTLTELFAALFENDREDVARELLALGMSAASSEALAKLVQAFQTVRRTRGESDNEIVFVVTPRRDVKHSGSVKPSEDHAALAPFLADTRLFYDTLMRLNQRDSGARGVALVQLSRDLNEKTPHIVPAGDPFQFGIKVPRDIRKGGEKALDGETFSRMVSLFIAAMDDDDIPEPFKVRAFKDMDVVLKGTPEAERDRWLHLEERYGSPAVLTRWFGIAKMKQHLEKDRAGRVQILKKLIAEGDLRGVDLRDFAGVLAKTGLKNVDLRSAQLPENLTSINFNGAILGGEEVRIILKHGGDLSGAVIKEDVTLDGIVLQSPVSPCGLPDDPKSLRRINFNGTVLGDMEVAHIIRHRGNLDGVDLRGRIISNIPTMVNVSLKGVSFAGARLDREAVVGIISMGGNINGADLNDADLSGVDLRGQNLQGTNLYGVDLRGASLPEKLKNISFDRARLGREEVKHILERGGSLKRANLHGASLVNLTFSDQMLTGTDFTECDLTGAIFERCYMEKAIFTGANKKDMIVRDDLVRIMDYEGEKFIPRSKHEKKNRNAYGS